MFYDPVYAGAIDRDLAEATRTVWGGTAFANLAAEPLPPNRAVRERAELQARSYNDPLVGALAADYQQEQFGQQAQQSGTFMPLGVTFVQETTDLPRVRTAFRQHDAPGLREGAQDARVADTTDLRRGSPQVHPHRWVWPAGAARARVQQLRRLAGLHLFGGNSELRGYEYLEFLGSKAAFFNAELRFPLIEAMLTPVGVLGGIRGVLFVNMGGGAYGGRSTDPRETGRQVQGDVQQQRSLHAGHRLPQGFDQNGNLDFGTIGGVPRQVSGFRLVDSRASYGIGLETFALGFPIHFDWSWKHCSTRNGKTRSICI